MKKYLILGGGHQGLAMAAHLSLNGEKVNLWNRTPQNIMEILTTHEIFCEGIINGKATLEKVSSNIDDVMEKIILVATPALAHRDIAKMLANKVDSNTTIVLNPGRTFGAFEFEKVLQQEGCKSFPKIAETQTIVYTCRKDNKNNVNIMAMKNDVMIASTKKENMREIFDDLPNCLKPNFRIVDSILETSLNNIGMLLHCTPTLLNTGWIENQKYKFKYYTDGITPTIASFIENIDNERLEIGRKMDIKLEPICEWFKRTYRVQGTTLLECIDNDVYAQIEAPSVINHRYITEDVPFGLVPLESLGKILKVNTPYVSTIIDLASLVMKQDFRKIGIKVELNDIKKLKNGD